MSPAQSTYSLSDIRGETKACENTLYRKNHPFQGCEPEEQKNLSEISNSLGDFDKGIAVGQIKKNIKTLSEAQIKNSLAHLQRIGIKNFDNTLNYKLQSLKKEGFKVSVPSEKEESNLSEKYLIASLRYNELRKIANSKINYLNEADRIQLKERIALLESRFPLLAGHGFMKLGINAAAHFKTNNMASKESADEAMLLDNYLFNDTPDKASALDFTDIKTSSAMGQMAISFAQNKNPRIQEDLRNILNQELQSSLADQLGALTKLKDFDTCETLTLHSEVTQFAVNSSAHSDDVFSELCECQKANAPVPESALLVSGVLSGAAGLLCIAPTGIGQLIACPTAAAAGWATAGGSAVNFSHQMSRYNSYGNQGSVLEVLESGKESKDELTILTRKESELTREMVNNNMLGLIGFSVGHVGFSSLTKIYAKSQISKSLSKLSAAERKKIEETFSSLNKDDQTRAFVVLEQLDDETRALLLRKPHLLNQELKGLRCEI
ncbi:hypothetical protein [Bdellovibrio sp. HCB2-146]|uniref:hypothetical protein n=1 Tax=Bdellovibrio sp. HCB2-146 TaxID=3394362 RepID=UPI0039BCF617